MTTSRLSKVFSKLWALVVSSLRYLLFIGCILTLVFNIFIIWFSNWIIEHANYFTTTDKGEFDPTEYGSIASVAIMALVGAHGAYSKKAKYLKVFAVMMALYSVAHILKMIPNLDDTDWKLEAREISQKMRAQAMDFEFYPDPVRGPNEATKAWNWLQSGLKCCGLVDHDDWRQWTSSSDRLPSSCCRGLSGPGDDLCTHHSASLFRRGCLEKVVTTYQDSIRGNIFIVVWYLSQSIVAIVVALKLESEEIRKREAVPSNQANKRQQKYRSSIQVPVNKAHVTSKPLYPDLTSTTTCNNR